MNVSWKGLLVLGLERKEVERDMREVHKDDDDLIVQIIMPSSVLGTEKSCEKHLLLVGVKSY